MKSSSKNSSIQSYSPGAFTLLLTDKQNPESVRTVIQLGHSELRRIAGALSRKPRGHTWQPTALVNQACIRLLKPGAAFKNRRHFFGAAARAMRRVLIDAARRDRAKKRGGGWTRAAFAEAEEFGFERPQDVLDLNVALKRLEAVRPELAEIVHLRVFAGLTMAEVAKILRIGESTARKRWAKARKQLATILTKPVSGLPLGGE